MKLDDRRDQQAISQLFVPSTKVGLVQVDNLVQLKESNASSRIDRLDRQRQVSLRASVAPGFALADRMQALREAADKLNMQPGYSTTISGRGRELERTFNEFIIAFLLSIAFMYMILASQFESMVHPVTILLSLPLAVPFALLSLWMTRKGKLCRRASCDACATEPSPEPLSTKTTSKSRKVCAARCSKSATKW